MFTNATILLSQVCMPFCERVVQDCEFSFIGKIGTDLTGRIVPCGTRAHLENAIKQKGVVGIIAPQTLIKLIPANLGAAQSETPMVSAWQIHEQLVNLEGFHWETFKSRIHPSAQIDPSAIIAEFDVVIGENTYIGPGTVIQPRSIIGADCHIGVGVVVGLEAFEIFDDGVSPRRILAQAGGVLIENNVTILAKTTVVRATFGGFTKLGRGTMVDTLVHIAHDVVTGENVTLVACSEISGRCVLETNAYIGPNAALRNGIKIGNNAKVTMGSVVTKDVSDNETVTGNFAVPHFQWLRFVKSLGKQ